MRIILVDGRLGRDAELKTSPNGRNYVSFSLANNSHVKNVDKTSWYEVLCFDQNTINKRLEYLKKGKYIFVCGRYDVTPYVAKDGSLRLNEQIVADRLDFISIGSKNNGDNTQQQVAEATTGYVNAGANSPVNVSVSENSNPSVTYAQPEYSTPTNTDGDDELPF
jgi:single-strand DNA-binding protein